MAGNAGVRNDGVGMFALCIRPALWTEIPVGDSGLLTSSCRWRLGSGADALLSFVGGAGAGAGEWLLSQLSIRPPTATTSIESALSTKRPCSRTISNFHWKAPSSISDMGYASSYVALEGGGKFAEIKERENLFPHPTCCVENSVRRDELPHLNGLVVVTSQLDWQEEGEQGGEGG